MWVEYLPLRANSNLVDKDQTMLVNLGPASRLYCDGGAQGVWIKADFYGSSVVLCHEELPNEMALECLARLKVLLRQDKKYVELGEWYDKARTRGRVVRS